YNDISLNYDMIQREARGTEPNTEIPINTIHFARSTMGGGQMNMISQITGGSFMYINTNTQSAAGAFAESRASFQREPIFLLNLTFGEARNSVPRIIMQGLFIAIWCLTLGFMVVAMLDNKNLIRDFLYPRFVISALAGIIFTVLMFNASFNGQSLVRLFLMFIMVVLIMPTYRLSSRS
ncbi:MAG: hypothetical protein FWE82_07360, partial [Defluviitaleaceae bacterium]|nr:hypothetical protein [Defluviitaleaceae bacterium]